jgi:hypothetical protein
VIEKTAMHLIRVEIKTNHVPDFPINRDQVCILKRIEPQIVPLQFEILKALHHPQTRGRRLSPNGGKEKWGMTF